MTTIAIILFVVLCPCVSYIMVKKHLIRWSGGMFLVKPNKKLVPIVWRNINGGCEWNIGANSVVEGFFLPGAEPWALPEVSIRGPFLRDKTKEKDWPWPVSYWFVEADGGVYVMFKTPLKGDDVQFFMLDVDAQHPWKNAEYSGSEGSGGSYYKFVQVSFKD